MDCETFPIFARPSTRFIVCCATEAGHCRSTSTGRRILSCARVYLAYLRLTGGLLGWVLHGDPDTYRYIPASISGYPGAEGVARLLEARGFVDVEYKAVLGGLMTIHIARKAGGT